jgi:hypothetical protein
MLSTILNSVGLIVDIIGAAMAYFNTLPVTYQVYLFNNNEGEKMEQKARRMNRKARIGFMLIGFGFMLQFISNWLN